jgi:cytochrome c5
MGINIYDPSATYVSRNVSVRANQTCFPFRDISARRMKFSLLHRPDQNACPPPVSAQRYRSSCPCLSPLLARERTRRLRVHQDASRAANRVEEGRCSGGLSTPNHSGPAVRRIQDNCENCHGEGLHNNSGVTFDLRRLNADEHNRFVDSVLNGKNAMPAWRGTLDTGKIEQLWGYIRANACDAAAKQTGKDR